MFDTTIVSVFGRGTWMATELQSRGMKTQFLDVTEQMGNWPPEDIEGPFGFFTHEKIPASYTKHLDTLSPFQALDFGLSIWTKYFPIQLKSPILRDLLTSHQLTTPDKPPQKREKFQKEWLSYFCHQWSSTIYLSNGQSHKKLDQAPFLKDFYVRSPTRPDFLKLKNLLLQNNVDYKEALKIIDMSFQSSKTISALEIQGEEKGLVKTDSVIWCLSSEETQFLNKQIFKKICHQVKESQWCWIRYRLVLKDCLELNVLPEHLSVIADTDLPWTHSNWMILHRTTLRNQIDAWIRIPTVQRFNKAYLTYRGDQIQNQIQQKLPLSQPEILSFPQEYFYSYEQIGAPRFPLFDDDIFKTSSIKNIENLFMCSPENWTRYNWLERFEKEQEILLEVLNRWKKLQLKKQRKGNTESDTALHSS